jgi:hypothetical protein
MANPDHSSYQRGIINRYYEHLDTIALQKLSEIVSDLYLAEGSRSTKLWTSARAALMKLTAPDDPRVANVLSTRSVTALAKLVSDLNTMAKSPPAPKPSAEAVDAVTGQLPAPPAATPQTPPEPGPAAPPDAEQLKHAMKAFRKRLKLTRLDEESKLGRNPMSAGKASKIVAIMAPREFPASVWEELARQGKLKSAGGSFYELAGE